MPQNREIIENCIQKLRRYSSWGVFQWRRHRERARVVADSLQNALDNNDIVKCQNIIIDQIRLMSSDEPTRPGEASHELYSVRSRFAASPKSKNLFGDYYKILYQTMQQFVSRGNPDPEAPGVAIIHHIWVGNPLEEDKMRKLMAVNHHLRRWWRNPQTNQPVKVRAILWTDDDNMINRAPYSESMKNSRSYPEIRHIDELMVRDDNLPPMTGYIRSMLHSNEPSFASDILRQIIMYKYGGLFLGMPWEFAHPSDPETFEPTSSTLKFKIQQIGQVYSYIRQPFTGMGDEGYLKNFKQHFNPDKNFRGKAKESVKLTFIVGGDAMYCGHAGHEVFRLILQIVYELLERLVPNPQDEYITGYRVLMRNYLPNLLREGADPQEIFMRGARAASLTDVHPGIVLDEFPVLQALMDLGYVVPCGNAADVPDATYVLKHPYGFEIQHEAVDVGGSRLFLDELNLLRGRALSWLRPDPKSKLSSEI